MVKQERKEDVLQYRGVYNDLWKYHSVLVFIVIMHKELHAHEHWTTHTYNYKAVKDDSTPVVDLDECTPVVDLDECNPVVDLDECTPAHL